jgi:hypothetical protein
MTQEEIKFCEDNIINFESVKLGFSRHIDFNILDEYTRIYQRNLDSQFVLNAWCGNCVFDMLKRLSAHYEGVLWANKRVQENQTTNQPNDKPIKNTRKRK